MEKNMDDVDKEIHAREEQIEQLREYRDKYEDLTQ